MASPIHFPQANLNLVGKDPGVQDMPVLNNGLVAISCWKLSDADIDQIQETGCIHVAVLAGAKQPPVFVGTFTETVELADSATSGKRRPSRKELA